MTTVNAALDAHTIGAFWRELRDRERIAKRDLLISHYRLGEMIAKRQCSLQAIADEVGVSRAYVGQVYDKYRNGYFDERIEALDREAS